MNLFVKNKLVNNNIVTHNANKIIYVLVYNSHRNNTGYNLL